MTRFRLAVRTCLGLLLLAPGMALAQRTPVAPPVPAAPSVRAPLVVGGQPLGAGGSIRLDDVQATRTAGGLCTYPVAYEVVNAGAGRTATPVTARLRVRGVVVATQAEISLAGGQAGRFTALVTLRPGTHAIELALDDADATREARSPARLCGTVVVAGPCGGVAGGPASRPQPSGPSARPAPGGAGTWASVPDPGAKALGSLGTTLKGWDGIGWKGLTTSPNFLDSRTITIDPERKQLVWWFRWSTTVPGVKAARWQVAHHPFGPSVSHTEGVIDKPVPPPGQSADFTIDLAPLKTPPVAKGVSSAPLVGKNAQKDPVPNPLYGQLPGAPKYLPGPDDVEKPPSLYVRVVPLDGAGKPMEPASPAVQLVFDEIEQPKIAIKNSPAVMLVGHVAGQPDAWQAWCYLVAPNDVYVAMPGATSNKTLIAKKGAKKNGCSGGGGGDPFSDFVDALVSVGGAFVELGKRVADFAHDTWESAKGEIVAAVASVLTDTVGCPGWCHSALATALNAGMVALGVPPSIPDFDALVSMGEDYIAAQVAQELAKASPVPIPPEVLKEASKKAAAEFVAAAKAKSSGAGAPAWVADPAKQYQPLVLKLQVRNEFATAIGPVTLTLKDVAGKHYKTRVVTLPPLGPKQVMTVPVTLDPVLGPHDWMKLYPGSADLPSSKCGQNPKTPGYEPPSDTPEQAAAKAKYQACTKQYQDLFATKLKLSEVALQKWAQKYTTEPVTLTMVVDGGTPSKVTAGPTIACQAALAGCVTK
jgi:hypothetical protein